MSKAMSKRNSDPRIDHRYKDYVSTNAHLNLNLFIYTIPAADLVANCHGVCYSTSRRITQELSSI